MQMNQRWNPAWGPNKLASNPDYKKMVAAVQSGDNQRANDLAVLVQRSMQSGMTPAQETGRWSLFFQQAAKIAPGPASGHAFVKLAQSLSLPVTEADASNLRVLQSAAAEKQRDLLLEKLTNWDRLPPQAQEATLAEINGLGKFLGQQPISVPANWVRRLTEDQRRRLLQGDQRLALEGSRNDEIKAHNLFMESLAQTKSARGATGTDQILAELIRKERVMNQAFERGLQTQKGGARSYVEWKRTNGPGTPGWETGPVDNPDDPDTAKAKFLWTLDHSAEALSGRVMDRIKRLGQQSQTPAPAGRTAVQRTTQGPAPIAAPSAAPAGNLSSLSDAEIRRRMAMRLLGQH
jgi:hypothetical protein